MAFWLTVGLVPQSATALAGAGYRSLYDLASVTQEQLLAIPGVGPVALALLEAALGRQIPWTRRRKAPPPETLPWPELVWLKRGVPPSAALTFVIEGMTLERLGSITREELLGMAGVGTESIKVCELMIGRKIPSRKFDPVAAFWCGQGIFPKPARALSHAGLGSIEDLRQLTREEILAVRGVKEITLARLEALLGSPIPSRSEYWLSRGLSLGIAHVLVREGIHTLADLAKLSREQLISFRGLGRYALWQCEKLLGHKLPSRERVRL